MRGQLREPRLVSEPDGTALCSLLGDQVFVPVRDTTEHTNYVAMFSSIAQTVTSILAIIIVTTR